MSIDILMATYEGERFLPAQLDSILAQTNTDWHLFVSDDGSRDGTWAILCDYAARLPEKITVRQNAVNSGGSAANFYGLLSLATADYVMFADQDDVWLPKKVEAALRAVRRMEERYGTETPLLVHSDLTVVDERGQVLYPSMFALQKLSGTGRSFAKQLVQNCITGCTVIFNRALLEKLRILPEHSVMHDWWVGLVAACFGKIGFLKTPYIHYRLHGNNVEGAKDFSSLSANLQMAAKKEQIRASLEKTYRQAEEFQRLYGKELSDGQREILEAYLRTETAPVPEKWQLMRRYGFWKTGLTRKVGQIVFQ